MHIRGVFKISSIPIYKYPSWYGSAGGDSSSGKDLPGEESEHGGKRVNLERERVVSVVEKRARG